MHVYLWLIVFKRHSTFFVLALDFMDTSTAYYVKYKNVILKVSISMLFVCSSFIVKHLDFFFDLLIIIVRRAVSVKFKYPLFKCPLSFT